ncbi:hypothetical protein C0995_008636 [Termitomyces sp. Mi166|nr:hypothetical protein C0995_008636 [Termitomyces sp. Mi166\
MESPQSKLEPPPNAVSVHRMEPRNNYAFGCSSSTLAPLSKSWVVGSIVAVTYMPVITALTRADPLKRKEDVDLNTIVRLTKFSELNSIRVFFRFLFTVPLLILSIDGIRPHHHINENMLWTDFLAMISAFGCSLSSALTLVVFFPRSIEGEIAARDERKRSKSDQPSADQASLYVPHHELTHTNVTQHSIRTFNHGSPAPGSRSLLLTSPIRQNVHLDMDSVSDSYHSPTTRVTHESHRTGSMDKYWADEEQDILASMPPLKPNRKMGDDIELGSIDQVREPNTPKLTTRKSNVNQMVHDFTSPIDLSYRSQKPGITWLTFNRSLPPHRNSIPVLLHGASLMYLLVHNLSGFRIPTTAALPALGLEINLM